MSGGFRAPPPWPNQHLARFFALHFSTLPSDERRARLVRVFVSGGGGMKYLRSVFGFPFVAIRYGWRRWRRFMAALCLWLSRRGESTSAQLLTDADADIKLLRELVRRMREDHARVEESWKGDVAIADRHIAALTEVIDRDRARVAAEMAIFTRREQDATQAMPGVAITQVED